MPKRNNSVARTAKEATIDDILSIMQKLNLGTCVLTFLVDDVSRVPTCTPESGTLMTITREMSSLKQEMTVMQEAMAGMQGELLRLQGIISKQESSIMQLMNHPVEQEVFWDMNQGRNPDASSTISSSQG